MGAALVGTGVGTVIDPSITEKLVFIVWTQKTCVMFRGVDRRGGGGGGRRAGRAGAEQTQTAEESAVHDRTDRVSAVCSARFRDRPAQGGENCLVQQSPGL